MAADDDRAATGVVKPRSLRDTFAGEIADDDRIVDQRAERVNRLQRVLATKGELERAVDAVAGAGLVGDSDDHSACSSASQKGPGGCKMHRTQPQRNR